MYYVKNVNLRENFVLIISDFIISGLNYKNFFYFVFFYYDMFVIVLYINFMVIFYYINVENLLRIYN